MKDKFIKKLKRSWLESFKKTKDKSGSLFARRKY